MKPGSVESGCAYSEFDGKTYGAGESLGGVNPKRSEGPGRERAFDVAADHRGPSLRFGMTVNYCTLTIVSPVPLSVTTTKGTTEPAPSMTSSSSTRLCRS